MGLSKCRKSSTLILGKFLTIIPSEPSGRNIFLSFLRTVCFCFKFALILFSLVLLEKYVMSTLVINC